MSATTTTTDRGARAGQSPGGAFASVLNAAIGTAASKLDRQVTGWTDKLNGIASGDRSGGGAAELADAGLDEMGEGGGAKQTAGAAGLKAGLHGKNPVWAAIKGAWRGGTPVVRAAIVAAVVSMILLLVLSPVLLLVFLLSLLVIAAVHRARSARS